MIMMMMMVILCTVPNKKKSSENWFLGDFEVRELFGYKENKIFPGKKKIRKTGELSLSHLLLLQWLIIAINR